MGLRVISLASGSSGNSILVEADGTALLVDTGMSAKYIMGELEQVGVSSSDLKAVFLTHEHSDHVGSARTIARRQKVPIIGNEATLVGAKLDRAYWEVLKTGGTTRVGPLQVSSFGLPHDSREAVGYFIEYDGWHVCVATDLGRAPAHLVEYVTEADLVVLEANHDPQWLIDGPYPQRLKARILSDKGHLSNEDSADVLVRAASSRPKWVWLAHLSEENNSPRRASSCVRSRLQRERIDTIEVAVAQRGRRSEVWRSDDSWAQLPLGGF